MTKLTKSSLIKIISTVAVIIVFLFLRFYRLDDSFYFFNDTGRDMGVLKLWQDTGKPPLLGPQNSALPFNQSAIYFYLLYPGFVVSHANPIANVYTLALVYVLSFFFCLYLSKKSKGLVSSFTILVSFFLISIHPQYLIQGRYVWNPSFVTPFAIIAIISFYLLIQKYSTKLVFLFSISIALAISFSYSVAPLLISFAINWLIFSRKKVVTHVISLFGSIALVNLPTLLFEVRHHFLLTQALLSGKAPVQSNLDLATKFQKLADFIFILPNSRYNFVFFILSLVLSIFVVKKYWSSKTRLLFISSFLYLSLAVLSLVIPFTVQAHYIFGFTSLLFIIIAALPKKLSLIIVIFASFIYLKPTYLSSYFKDAPRTYTQMKQCFAKYCQQFKDPTFVSVQSSLHPFHNGPEHRFLMRQAGCNVKEIETENGSTQYMSLVLDDGSYSPKTSFYELELFGKNKLVSRLTCLPNFEILTLKKL